MFDFGSIDNFISPYALGKCRLEASEHNDFNSIKMDSGVKQAVGPSVDNCRVDLGVCVTQVKVYVTSLGTYDLIIGMNWLEEHRAFLDYYEKKVLFVDDKGKAIEIQSIKSKVSLSFISTMNVK